MQGANVIPRVIKRHKAEPSDQRRKFRLGNRRESRLKVEMERAIGKSLSDRDVKAVRVGEKRRKPRSKGNVVQPEI